MSYHKLMMENNTMYTKKVFDNVADRKLSKGQPKILEEKMQFVNFLNRVNKNLKEC